MFTISNRARSFTTTVLTTATSVLLAFGATQTVLAQQTANQEIAIVKNPSAIQNIESFVSADELLHQEIHCTPASLDINALKRTVSYPEAALKQHVSGRFELIVYVGSNGAVTSVNFVAERPEYTSMIAIIASACEAVKKSQFTPATLNNKAISSAVRIPFSFVL